MKYSIIFKYVGGFKEDEREFNLNNIGKDLGFTDIIEFNINKQYIKEEGGVYFNNIEYIISKTYLDIADNEIICIFGLISLNEKINTDTYYNYV